MAFLLTDRIGRRRAIIGASVLAACVGVGFAYAPSEIAAVVLGFTMFALIYFMVSVIIAGYVPELFPTAVRMRGVGVCSTFGRFVTIVVPYGAVALYSVGGLPFVLGAVAAALLVQAAAVWVGGTETKREKPGIDRRIIRRHLEEIAA